MLRVTPDDEQTTPRRSHRFASQVLHRVDSFVAQEEAVPLWQALSIAFAESLEAQAAAAMASLPQQPSYGDSQLATEVSYAASGAADSAQVLHAVSPPAGEQGHAAVASSDVLVHGDGGGQGSPEEPARQPHKSAAPEGMARQSNVRQQSAGGKAASNQADVSVDGQTRPAEAAELASGAERASAARPADHAAAAGDTGLDNGATAGQSRRMPGFDALQVLLEQRLMPQEVPQRSQSARPARGGKRAATRRRAAVGWDPEAAARLRWSYDGGVGYGVPALELEELLELEAQTREVARASVAEFAEAKRRQSPDQVCCELDISANGCVNERCE